MKQIMRGGVENEVEGAENCETWGHKPHLTLRCNFQIPWTVGIVKDGDTTAMTVDVC